MGFHFFKKSNFPRKNCTFRTLSADPYKRNRLIGHVHLKSTKSALLGVNQQFNVKSVKC